MGWEKVHEETEGIYTYVLSITPSDVPIDWDFSSEEERQDTLSKIESGILLYFDAKVECYVQGNVYGIDLLGACCYYTMPEFLNDYYYYDMKEQSKAHAIEVIEALKKVTKH